MRIADRWHDFEIIDSSCGEKLERWGTVFLIRPDPQVIWKTPKIAAWNQAHANYLRSESGGGSWKILSNFKDEWVVSYDSLKFNIRPTGFKHTGLFPEQAVNWDFMSNLIKQKQVNGKQLNILNLFAYTGGATLCCAEAGAKVCHVDASKGMVAWAKENAKLSGLSDKPIRYIVDDCSRFVEREIRRGVRYDAVIMDPPSYGRGPSGELWKLEDSIFDLVTLCSNVLCDSPAFFLLNSYTTGLSPAVMQYILGSVVAKKFGGTVTCDEIGLPVKNSNYPLPCGSTAIYRL